MISSEAQKAWKRKDYLDKKAYKKAYYLARDTERYYRFREILIEAKRKPCIDCGHEFPTCAMDLHHRNQSEKIRNVSTLKDFSSEKKLREEIAKCDVICACCHRIRSDKDKVYFGNSDSGNLRPSDG
jgi:hypothetical protein